VSSTISSLQGQVDQQAVNAISSTNGLLKQIFDLNSQIKNAMASGTSDQSSALLDQRDVALTKLAQMVSIKTSTNADGSVNVSTGDGFNLVSNTYAQLSYIGGAQNGTYGNISIQDVNPANGNLLATPQALDPHLTGGSLKGLIDMRD